MSQDQVIEIVTTVASEAEAGKLAEMLVKGGLAACVQVSGPVSSFYRWKGRLEVDQEWKVTAKTLRSAYSKVEEAVISEHSYETPQILALPVVEVLPSYRQWIAECIGDSGSCEA